MLITHFFSYLNKTLSSGQMKLNQFNLHSKDEIIIFFFLKVTTITAFTTTKTTTKTSSTTTTTATTSIATTTTTSAQVKCGVKKAGTKIVGGVETQVGLNF